MLPLPDRSPAPIRAIDPYEDLSQITDLIELCFSGTLDADGLDYIRQLREIEAKGDRTFWYKVDGISFSYPVSGFVWVEEDSRISGNLTIIPVQHEKVWYFLIANVAVHPERRQQGIARRLTERALRFASDHGIRTLWLHVRENNASARRLYEGLAFTAETMRTTWLLEKNRLPLPASRSDITWRRGSAEPAEEQLRRNYPLSVRWNLPLDLSQVRSGLLAQLRNLFLGAQVQASSAYAGSCWLGTFYFQHAPGFADPVWLAVDPDLDSRLFNAMMRDFTAQLRVSKPIQINFPAGKQAEAFISAGWRVLNTLIWMKRDV